MKLIRMAALCAAGLSLSNAAHADTLIDNVQGIAIGPEGEIERFSALWFDDDGKIVQLLDRGDARPADITTRIDGDGKYLIPGLIDAHAHIMGIGFGALSRPVGHQLA